MKKRLFTVLYISVLFGTLLTAFGTSRAVTVISENAPISYNHCVIIDAGHGGVDGGATSCTGVLESRINLEIAQKLEDLLHLMGMQTKMVRTGDYSIHTKADSIAAKKVSDLKERVRIVNNTPGGILVSIHQNYFTQSQYYGAQVFYNMEQGSESLAKNMQSLFRETLNAGSKRQAKKSNGIYLMEHIERPGVLIECGFLSNPQEEAQLRDQTYQKKVCAVIAASVSEHLFCA